MYSAAIGMPIAPQYAAKTSKLKRQARVCSMRALLAPFVLVLLLRAALAYGRAPLQWQHVSGAMQSENTALLHRSIKDNRYSSLKSDNTSSSGLRKGKLTPAAVERSAARRYQSSQKCPAWLAEYAAFHKNTRGQPDARYLVFSIDHGVSGLGDRLRGMMFATRLAVSLQRLVLFTWRNSPHEPQRYLPPSGDIDWRLEGINGYDPLAVPVAKKGSKHFMGSEKFKDAEPPDCSPTLQFPCFRAFNHRLEQRGTSKWIVSGGLIDFNDQQFLTILTNNHADASCKGCPSLALNAEISKSSSMDNPAACLFHYLFSTSDEVHTAVDEQLLQLLGPRALQPDFRFVGMHLRLGGMPKEMTLKINKGSGAGDLADVIGGMQCAVSLGTEHGINMTDTPVLLITDSHRVRRFVREGHLRHAVTPNIRPTHLARMKGTELQDGKAAISSYIDLALLARSSCVVASASGFSNTAWLLGGGKACVADLHRDAYVEWRQHHPCEYVLDT